MGKRFSGKKTVPPKTTLMDRRVKKKPNMTGSQESMYPKGKYKS